MTSISSLEYEEAAAYRRRGSPMNIASTAKAALLRNFSGSADAKGYRKCPQDNLLPGIGLASIELYGICGTVLLWRDMARLYYRNPIKRRHCRGYVVVKCIVWIPGIQLGILARAFMARTSIGR